MTRRSFNLSKHRGINLATCHRTNHHHPTPVPRPSCLAIHPTSQTPLQLAFSQIYTQKRYKNEPPKYPVQVAQERIVALAQQSVVPGTANNRSVLYTDFLAWAENEKLPLTGASGTMYVMARRRVKGEEDLKHGTLARYASDLNQVGQSTLQDWDSVPLAQLARLLRQQAEVPSQAVPVPQEVVYSYARDPAVPRILKVAALLLWKTAMRTGDLLLLRCQDVVLLEAEEGRVLLDLWRSKTRTAAGRTASDTRFAVAAGETMSLLTAYISERLVLGPDARLVPFSSETLLASMRNHPGCPQDLSGHSFRVGALQRLLKLAGRGIAVSPLCLRMTARHSSRDPVLPPVTMMYLRASRVELAEYLLACVRADVL